MKIALCTPVYDHPKAQFTFSLVSLILHTLKQRPDIEFEPLNTIGLPIHTARENIALRAVTVENDWLLWLDDDQTFPPDALLRLLAHNLPFVGCNYRKRNVGSVLSSARRKDGTGRMPGIEAKGSGVEPVNMIGFGAVLIAAEVFRAIKRPWFQLGPHGEDGYFCEQAIKAGFTPHVDHALSMEVGHIAETVLRF